MARLAALARHWGTIVARAVLYLEYIIVAGLAGNVLTAVVQGRSVGFISGSAPIVEFVRQYPLVAIGFALALLLMNLAAFFLSRFARALRERAPVIPPIEPENVPPDERLNQEAQRLRLREEHIQEVRGWLRRDPGLRQPLLNALFLPAGFLGAASAVLFVLSVVGNIATILAILGFTIKLH